MSQIKTVQLRDRSGNKISPFVPASTVYYIYGEGDDKRLANIETLIGSVDIDKINDLQDEAVSDIIELSGSSIEKIINERDSYQADINTLSALVQTIIEQQFILNVENEILTDVSSFPLTSEYYYKVTEGDSTASNINVIVTHQRNDGPETEIYNGGLAEQSLTGDSTNLAWGRDIFKIKVTKQDGKSNTKTDKRYVCIFGAYTDEITEGELIDPTKMGRVCVSSFSSANITTTLDKRYIWIVVPKYVFIQNVTSQGIDVSLVKRGPYTIGGCEYNAYRSLEPLIPTQWSLSITSINI